MNQTLPLIITLSGAIYQLDLESQAWREIALKLPPMTYVSRLVYSGDAFSFVASDGRRVRVGRIATKGEGDFSVLWSPPIPARSHAITAVTRDFSRVVVYENGFQYLRRFRNGWRTTLVPVDARWSKGGEASFSLDGKTLLVAPAFRTGPNRFSHKLYLVDLAKGMRINARTGLESDIGLIRAVTGGWVSMQHHITVKGGKFILEDIHGHVIDFNQEDGKDFPILRYSPYRATWGKRQLILPTPFRGGDMMAVKGSGLLVIQGWEDRSFFNGVPLAGMVSGCTVFPELRSAARGR